MLIIFVFVAGEFSFASELISKSNADSSTLAPSLSTDPLCTVIRLSDGTFDISEGDVSVSFKNRWSFLEVSYLAGQIIVIAREDPDIKKPGIVLAPLIKKRLGTQGISQGPNIPGYDIENIREVWKNGRLEAFKIPFVREGHETIFIRVSLPAKEEVDTSDALALRLPGGDRIGVEVLTQGEQRQKREVEGENWRKEIIMSREQRAEVRKGEIIHEKTFKFEYPAKTDIQKRNIFLTDQWAKISGYLREVINSSEYISPERAVLLAGIFDKLIENSLDSLVLKMDEEVGADVAEHSIRISVAKDPSKRTLRISLEDEGSGIPLNTLIAWQVGKFFTTKDIFGATRGSDGRGIWQTLRIARDNFWSVSFNTRTEKDDGHEFKQCPYGGISIARKKRKSPGTTVTVEIPELLEKPAYASGMDIDFLEKIIGSIDKAIIGVMGIGVFMTLVFDAAAVFLYRLIVWRPGRKTRSKGRLSPVMAMNVLDVNAVFEKGIRSAYALYGRIRNIVASRFDDWSLHSIRPLSFVFKAISGGEPYFIKISKYPRVGRREYGILREISSNPKLKKHIPEKIFSGRIGLGMRQVIRDLSFAELDSHIPFGARYVAISPAPGISMREDIESIASSGMGEDEKERLIFERLEKVIGVLSEFHREGFFHRDLDAGEIFFEEGTGRITLVDFNMAVTPRYGIETLRQLGIHTAWKYLSVEGVPPSWTCEKHDVYSIARTVRGYASVLNEKSELRELLSELPETVRKSDSMTLEKLREKIYRIRSEIRISREQDTVLIPAPEGSKYDGTVRNEVLDKSPYGHMIDKREHVSLPGAVKEYLAGSGQEEARILGVMTEEREEPICALFVNAYREGLETQYLFITDGDNEKVMGVAVFTADDSVSSTRLIVEIADVLPKYRGMGVMQRGFSLLLLGFSPALTIVSSGSSSDPMISMYERLSEDPRIKAVITPLSYGTSHYELQDISRDGYASHRKRSFLSENIDTVPVGKRGYLSLGEVVDLPQRPLFAGYKSALESLGSGRYPESTVSKKADGSKTDEGPGSFMPSPESEVLQVNKLRTVIGCLRGLEKERVKAVKRRAERSDSAAGAQEEPRLPVIAIGESWIKGLNGQNAEYRDPLRRLITSIRLYCERRGIPFIVAPDDELPGLIAQRPPGTRAVILTSADAEKGILTSEPIKKLLANELYTIVGIDPSKFTEESYMRLVELLRIAMGLFMGIEPDENGHSDMEILPPDGRRGFYIIVPYAEPMDHELLRPIYAIQTAA